MTRTVVCPGTVVSKNDGDLHFISYTKLIRLWQLDPRDCEIWRPYERYPEGTRFVGPLYSGDYPAFK